MATLQLGSRTVLGYVTCLQCRQYLSVPVKVEIVFCHGTKNHTPHLTVNPKVELNSSEIAAAMIWAKNTHTGPIVLFSDLNQVSGVSVWTNEPPKPHERRV